MENIEQFPFHMVPLKYSLTSFEEFLDFQSLSIHYNQIYKEYVDELNEMVSKESSLKNLTLDEILFNENLISPLFREKLLNVCGAVYNHNVYFNSITPNPIESVSKELKAAMDISFGSIRAFYVEFKKACINSKGCTFVMLVCDEHGSLKIETVKGNNTTVPKNLCPIIGIDLFEHSYYLKYKNNLENYVDKFMKYICYSHANKVYDECLKLIKK